MLPWQCLTPKTSGRCPGQWLRFEMAGTQGEHKGRTSRQALCTVPSAWHTVPTCLQCCQSLGCCFTRWNSWEIKCQICVQNCRDLGFFHTPAAISTLGLNSGACFSPASQSRACSSKLRLKKNSKPNINLYICVSFLQPKQTQRSS